MPRIRISTTPPGFAPEMIRKEWVEIIIPLVDEEEAARVEATMDPESPSAGGYIVRGEDAVQALFDAGRDEAGAFWMNPFIATHFRFSAECCELLR